MSNTKRVAFYGSLRRGEYNYESFVRHYGAENYRYQKTSSISGFKLYSLGSYPAINKVKVGEESSNLIVDVFEVSEPVYQSIRAMELGANYKEITVDIEGEEVILYEYRTPVSEDRRVLTGDWSEHLSKRNQ